MHDFDFRLPADLIAQVPLTPRDHSRLMIVHRKDQRITHDTFRNLGSYLYPNDVLVVNDTKVIPARLRGRKTRTGGQLEVLLLHEISDGEWEVLLRPAAKAPPGTVIAFGGGILRGEVIARPRESPAVIKFIPADIHPLLDLCGEVPLPPYIKRSHPGGPPSQDAQRYQTIYARHPGAIAAPTAGLHFTPTLLAALQHRGIRRASLTLHVGWGTFQPVRTTMVEHHHMGREFYRLTAAEADTIHQSQAAGGRVIAVGTTVTRTLETIRQQTGRLTAHSGWSELYIYPGYQFQVVEALITNFHLPRSTLFLLVCAFAGRELMQEAYRLAIAEGYRFYSYGDAMFIQ